MINLTYEELITVLTQVEAHMTSQPLTPMLFVNGDGVEPLMPGHFLIGRPITVIPEGNPPDLSITLLSRWKLCQYQVSLRVPYVV